MTVPGKAIWQRVVGWLGLNRVKMDPRIRAQAAARPDEFWADERCHRCGACCGASDGHPCEHLKHDGGRYYCDIFEHRFGVHHTVTGQAFLCVPIKRLIETHGGYRGCAYLEPLPEKPNEGESPD